MNRRALLLLAACVVVITAWLLTRDGGTPSAKKRAGSRGAAGGSPTSAPGSGYDRFKLIHTRNVFDPDRRAPRTGPAPTATPPPARADYVALTGTFFDGEKKQLAFFSGSRPEYNKVLSVREQIAGATINKITGSNVEVLRDGKPVTVAVGQTVPFDDSAPGVPPAPVAAVPDDAPRPGGPAAPAGPTAPVTATASAPAIGPVAAAPGGPAPTANGGPGAVSASPNPLSATKIDEIRRRMEEKRRQELK